MALTHIPLTEEQKALPSGMVLPSGEGNYYDSSQDHISNYGYGINVPFVADTSGSGLIESYGPSGTAIEKSGTFSPYGLAVPHSNSQYVAMTQIDDFAIFNDYIHYYTPKLIPCSPVPAILIPFLSTADRTVAENFDPYSEKSLTDIYNSR